MMNWPHRLVVRSSGLQPEDPSSTLGGVTQREKKMEHDLFDWCGWDLVSDTILQFFGCTLKKPIGVFKVGDLVPCIVVDFETGILQVLDAGRGKKGTGIDFASLLSEHQVKMVLDTELAKLESAEKLHNEVMSNRDREIGDLKNQIDQLQATLRCRVLSD